MGFFTALTQHAFLQYALLGGILASIICGIIGPFIVVRKISYVAGGISHAVLGGMGIAYFFNKSPIIGALITALIVALIIGFVGLKLKKFEETIISVLWSVGMAIGIIFISRSPGYNADLMSYLFGNILMISKTDLYLLLILDVIVFAVVTVFYKQLLAVTFDEEFAKVRGIRVNFYYLLLLCMVALTVVSLIQVVGLILVLALLTIPAVIATLFANVLSRIIVFAVILGCVFTSFGLILSYQVDLPSGAIIILLAAAGFVFSLVMKSTVRVLIRKN